MGLTTAAQIQARRAKIRDLMQLFLTARQIWENVRDDPELGRPSEDTIRRDLGYWRQHDRQWATEHRTIESRVRAFYKLLMDAQQRVIREAWVQALAAEKAGAKAAFLGIAQRGLEHLSQLLNLTGLTLKELEATRDRHEIDERLTNVERQLQLLTYPRGDIPR